MALRQGRHIRKHLTCDQDLYAQNAYDTLAVMSQSFGEIVRQKRAQHGWDQAELAQRLGSVGQQAISRWESGTSRPRRTVVAQIANLLDLDVNHPADCGRLSGCDGRQTGRGSDFRSRPSWRRCPSTFFRRMTSSNSAPIWQPCCTPRRPYLGMAPRVPANGVDVIVRHSAGKPTGIQCKREKQFGPAKVRKAVGELVMEVRECCIYLSRVATADARKEIPEASWLGVRDAKDLSGAVRNLADRDAAIRLVDTYFPGTITHTWESDAWPLADVR